MQPETSRSGDSRACEGCDRILRAGTILALDGPGNIIDDGAVAVKDGRIRDIGPAPRIMRQYSAPEIRSFGPDSIMMPGLVNAHTHAPMTLLRGIADDLPLMEWLEEHIFPRERRLSGELIELGGLLACAEMARFGVTAFCDMYILEDALFRAVDRAGMRLLAGEVLFAFAGPAYVSWQDGLALAEEQVGRWQGHERIRAAIMPHSVYTTNARLLEECASLSARLDAPLHIHLAESPEETAGCLRQNGMRPVAWCEAAGLLGPRTSIAHAVDLTADELDLLAERRVSVAHCPRSNMKLASGVCPLPDLLERGVTVGLGTDGAASSNSLNLFAEMHAAALVHKVSRRDPVAVPAALVLQMATSGGAACLGIDGSGSLAPGGLADLIVLDGNSPNLLPRHGLASALVYSATGAETVLTMVNGEIVYDNGTYPRLDMPLLRREAQAAARSLRSRI